MHATNYPAQAGGFRLRLRSLFERLAETAVFRRQYRHLAELDDRLLRDIGLERGDLDAAYKKKGWKAPPHWFA